jgi:hypothetical protein
MFRRSPRSTVLQNARILTLAFSPYRVSTRHDPGLMFCREFEDQPSLFPLCCNLAWMILVVFPFCLVYRSGSGFRSRHALLDRRRDFRFQAPRFVDHLDDTLCSTEANWDCNAVQFRGNPIGPFISIRVNTIW